MNQVLQGPIRNLGGVVSIAGYEPFLSSSQLPSVKYDGPILVLQGEKDPVIGSKANGEKLVRCKRSMRKNEKEKEKGRQLEIHHRE